jgi:hypothetical protein
VPTDLFERLKIAPPAPAAEPVDLFTKHGVAPLEEGSPYEYPLDIARAFAGGLTALPRAIFTGAAELGPEGGKELSRRVASDMNRFFSIPTDKYQGLADYPIGIAEAVGGVAGAAPMFGTLKAIPQNLAKIGVEGALEGTAIEGARDLLSRDDSTPFAEFAAPVAGVAAALGGNRAEQLLGFTESTRRGLFDQSTERVAERALQGLSREEVLAGIEGMVTDRRLSEVPTTLGQNIRRADNPLLPLERSAAATAERPGVRTPSGEVIQGSQLRQDLGSQDLKVEEGIVPGAGPRTKLSPGDILPRTSLTEREVGAATGAALDDYYRRVRAKANIEFKRAYQGNDFITPQRLRGLAKDLQALIDKEISEGTKAKEFADGFVRGLRSRKFARQVLEDPLKLNDYSSLNLGDFASKADEKASVNKLNRLKAQINDRIRQVYDESGPDLSKANRTFQKYIAVSDRLHEKGLSQLHLDSGELFSSFEKLEKALFNPEGAGDSIAELRTMRNLIDRRAKLDPKAPRFADVVSATFYSLLQNIPRPREGARNAEFSFGLIKQFFDTPAKEKGLREVMRLAMESKGMPPANAVRASEGFIKLMKTAEKVAGYSVQPVQRSRPLAEELSILKDYFRPSKGSAAYEVREGDVDFVSKRIANLIDSTVTDPKQAERLLQLRELESYSPRWNAVLGSLLRAGAGQINVDPGGVTRDTPGS